MDVRHRHIQKVHLFSSKNIIQLCWFSPLQAPSHSPQASLIHFWSANTFCVLPGSERLCACILACLQSLVRFFWVFVVFAGVQKFWDQQKTSQLCSSCCARVMYSTSPPKKTKTKTKKQNKEKTQKGKRRRRELEEEEKESILGKKF